MGLFRKPGWDYKRKSLFLNVEKSTQKVSEVTAKKRDILPRLDDDKGSKKNFERSLSE